MYMKDELKKKLEELIEDKKDSDTSLSTKRQAELIGIPYPTFMKYVNGTASCSIDNLAFIANYYNVSADYLLGLSPNPTTDESEKTAIAVTGLTESAVKRLKNVKDCMKNELSFILESQYFSDIVTIFYRAKFKLDYLEGNNPELIKETIVNELNQKIPKEKNELLHEISIIGLEPMYKQKLAEMAYKMFDEFKEALNNG